MKKLLLITAILISAGYSYGQTYQKLYTQNQYYQPITGGLVAGAYSNNTALVLENTFNIADSMGNIILSTPLANNPTAMLRTPNDGGYVFATKQAQGYAGLYKIDSTGDPLWQLSIPPDTTTNIFCFRVDNAGNTYVLADSGYSYYNFYFLQKYDPNGNLLWSKTMNMSSSYSAFTVNSAGDILLVGGTSVGACFARELNTNGDSLWEHTYTPRSSISYPFDIAILPSGNLVLLNMGYVNTVYGNCYAPELYELSSTGSLMDSMLLPGLVSYYSIFKLNISADGSLVVYTTSYDSTNLQTNASLIDVSPFGHVNWQRTFLGDGRESAFDISPLPNGFIISGDTIKSYYVSNGYTDIIYNSAIFVDRLGLNGLYQSPTIVDTTFNVYSASAVIDTNDIAATVNNNGNLFSPDKFLVPKPISTLVQTPSAVYDANIWVAGKSNGKLYNSSEMYLSDYHAGPSGTLPQDAEKWDYIWPISRMDVISVKNDFDSNHAITRPIPTSVLTWPAKGNASATGNAGAPLTINQDMAPFYDRNGDGIYNVYDGDYPMMRGDKMLWWINNDLGSQSQNPMGIDRRYSVYQYNCAGDSDLNNTLFLSVSIKNQSNRAYDSVTIGAFVDFDLGCADNDRTGSIPSRNTFYVYNGEEPGVPQQNGLTCDEGAACPSSEVGYGCVLPIISATFLNDTMKCAGYFTNGEGYNHSEPVNDMQYYRYMNGQWADGTPFTYGGYGYAGTTPYPFAFPGNPADTSQWSEISSGIEAGDRISIAAIGPFSLGVGDTMSFDMAFIFHQDSFNFTPSITDSGVVYQHIDSITRYYASETFPCWYDSSKSLKAAFNNVGIQEIAPGIGFSVIPNPNNGNFNIHISNAGLGDYSISITDMLGRLIYYDQDAHAQDQTIRLGNAISGVYSVTIAAQNYTATKKVVVTTQ